MTSPPLHGRHRFGRGIKPPIRPPFTALITALLIETNQKTTILAHSSPVLNQN